MKERKKAKNEVETKAKRKRKTNFSINKMSVITENVPKNLHIIQSKLTNNVTNKKKNQIWEEVMKDVDTVVKANRIVQKVRDKWKNLHSTAKRESKKTA